MGRCTWAVRGGGSDGCLGHGLPRPVDGPSGRSPDETDRRARRRRSPNNLFLSLLPTDGHQCNGEPPSFPLRTSVSSCVLSHRLVTRPPSESSFNRSHSRVCPSLSLSLSGGWRWRHPSCRRFLLAHAGRESRCILTRGHRHGNHSLSLSLSLSLFLFLCLFNGPRSLSCLSLTHSHCRC